MGMADVNRAFSRGLGARASCAGGVMLYEKDANGKRNINRLAFVVTKPDGSKVEVTDVLPVSDDPVAKARAMGEAFTGD